ncbi:emp24/gp25L/p24 family protein [Heterostelium album PN500]|uniref:Emp24/gp25L/p24 family protein n=2 Tax=Heterostelium TaxID=2058189 RepID=D3B7N4_HETP5|nr:emp24/gp25L/p24 family protein [Heterostelium album PN500]EFA82777.1 emp24/gp25L/p24 family protein [Heterostelium album PN500]|eukprot:XP_020434894.1 emp24/gp25L/p24 family protein [Heterostelium album PN500]
MIISPDKRVLYKGQRETEGTKVMKSNFAGVYSFCFSNQMSSLTEKTVSFMILVGEQSTITQDLATKGQMPQLESQIMALADGVQAVKSEQYYFRMREATHRNTAESTNSRVVWWSIFEALILVAMSAWQIYYLRRFFEVKRAV